LGSFIEGDDERRWLSDTIELGLKSQNACGDGAGPEPGSEWRQKLPLGLLDGETLRKANSYNAA
jgi:hypothetical protein